MKTVKFIYAALMVLMITSMVFSLVSCGVSAMPREGTYNITTAIGYDDNGNKNNSCDMSDTDQSIEIKVEDENTIVMEYIGFTFYFNKNTDGVFMGSLGWSIESTMTWDRSTITITDLDPDSGLPTEAVVFKRK